METHSKESTWSVSEAKSRLSEVLRRARRSPQYIGKRDQCVVISREEWEAKTEPKESLSVWLLKHAPGIELDIPARGQSAERANPFES